MENLKITQVQGVNANELIKAIAQAVKSELTTPEPQQPKNSNELMSRKQVAEHFGVTIVTVHNWTKKGVLKAYRVGNKVLYKKDEVLTALKNMNK